MSEWKKKKKSLYRSKILDILKRYNGGLPFSDLPGKVYVELPIGEQKEFDYQIFFTAWWELREEGRVERCKDGFRLVK